jgi:RHS repeat-associated protein
LRGGRAACARFVDCDTNRRHLRNRSDALIQGFTGRESDQDGLYFYRARYYNPSWGRFISEDPIGFNGGDEDLYRYVGDDPISGWDPLGLCDNQKKCHTVKMMVTAYDDNGPGSDWSHFKSGDPSSVGPGTVAVSNTNPPAYPYGTTFNVLNPDGTSAYNGTAWDTGAGWDANHQNVDPSQWIDIWLPTNSAARKWGAQWRLVMICE